MSAGVYANINGVTRKGKKLYAKVNGVVRPIKEAWVKVNGVSRRIYQNEITWMYTLSNTYDNDNHITAYGVDGTYAAYLKGNFKPTARRYLTVTYTVNNGNGFTISAGKMIQLLTSCTDDNDSTRLAQVMVNDIQIIDKKISVAGTTSSVDNYTFAADTLIKTIKVYVEINATSVSYNVDHILNLYARVYIQDGHFYLNSTCTSDQ